MIAVSTTQLITRAKNIRALVLDVDGVLTDGRLYFSSEGDSMHAFHVHDGVGIHSLQNHGVVIAVISGRSSAAVSRRMSELSVTAVHQGVADKLAVYGALLAAWHFDDAEVAYMGDDLPDLALMQRAGFSIAPSNAVNSVKAAADWVTSKAGGEGAVREACDFICYAKENNARMA